MASHALCPPLRVPDGETIAGGSLETYLAGTSTPLATFADADGATPNPTTMSLNAAGRPVGAIYLATTDAAGSPLAYKFIVKDADGATLYTQDDVRPGGTHLFDLTGAVNLDAFATLQDAIDFVGASLRTLVVTTVRAVAADTTVPANVELMFIGAGRLDPAAGVTLTVTGAITAPDRLLFGGAGTTTFSGYRVRAAIPEWWGAVGDGVSSDAMAIAAAHAAHPRVEYGVGKVYRVDAPVTLPPYAVVAGAGWGDGNGAIIECAVQDGAAFSIGASGVPAPQVTVQDVCMRGADRSCDAITATDNALFTRFSGVNFQGLRRAVAATGNHNWYWTTFAQCRFRDLFIGFENDTAEKADEISFHGCEYHNAADVYFRLSLTGIGGTFLAGETVTGGTSGDTATVEGVAADHLIVSRPKGTNAAPLTLGFAVGETVTGGASAASGALAAVQGNRSVLATQCDGITMVGCDHNNQGAEFDGCVGLTVEGGYWESYNADIPALKLTDCTGHVAIHKVPGSYFEADDASYRGISGRLPGGNRTHPVSPVVHAYRAIFPDPGCSTQTAIDALEPASMTRVLGGEGILLSSTTATNSRVGFSLLPTVPGAGCLVRIKCTVGSVEVRWQDMERNAGVEVDSAVSTDWQSVRLATPYAGGANPMLLIRCLRVDGGVMEAEIDYLVVVDADAIPGQPCLAPEIAAHSLYLPPLAAEPANKRVGMIVVADNANWDPAGVIFSDPYPAHWDGVAWQALS